MRRKVGVILILLGVVLMAAAGGLYIFNQQEDLNAAAASQDAIVKVVEVIRENIQQTTPVPEEPPVPTAPQEKVMTVTDIDGYGYIGFVGIPSLGLELPVMADWSDAQLKIAPCRYSGSIYTDDLVLMAHNYKRHFGKIRRLKTGDLVTFTDMEGGTQEYQVVAVEILSPTAVEEVTSGEYDLTLFTCTYGGENRITVRCDRLPD